LRAAGAVAGAAIGLRAPRARAESPYPAALEKARGEGRPLLLAIIDSTADDRAFQLAQTAILAAADHELAIRLWLVSVVVTDDSENVRSLTGQGVRSKAPAVVLNRR
jgi:hypothetical protein